MGGDHVLRLPRVDGVLMDKLRIAVRRVTRSARKQRQHSLEQL